MGFTDYIPEIRSRIDAAKEHIDNFQLKSDRYFQKQPNTVIREEDIKGETKIIRYRFVVLQTIPPDLRTPIRACIGELRSILDNLIWGLSQIVGKNHSCGIKFPVFLTESSPNPKIRSFNTWMSDNQSILSKFPAGAVDLIRQLQPFNAYNSGQWFTAHPIHILNKIANQDKHKMPLKVSGINNNFEWRFEAFVIEPSPAPTPLQVLENNSVILTMTMSAIQPSENVEFKIASHICFDKSSPASGAPVYEFLIDMHNFIRDEVITKFEPFFPK